jgi:hypothetical protein
MKYEVYELLHVSDDLSIFEFESIGPRGRIVKRVQFLPTHLDGVFSLAMGNVQPDTNLLDDVGISNNGDRNKILATIADTVDKYSSKYPERWVHLRRDQRRDHSLCPQYEPGWIFS